MRIDRPVIELPRIIDVRKDAYDGMHETLEQLKLPKKGLLLVDEITINIAGNRIFDHLSNHGYELTIEYVKDATIDEAKRITQLYPKENLQFAIAVGGGRVIDVAKSSSYNARLPFISVPTVASHDGIASARASLVGMGKKHSLTAHSPLAVIADIATIANAPRRFTISGFADILSNKTAVLDWLLSERITGEHVSQYAVALSNMTAETMVNMQEVIAKDKLEGAYTVIKGLITSSMAMCIAGSSRPASGAEHMISHALDQELNMPSLHGEQCGVAAIITMFLHGGDWQQIKHALKTVGAPTTAAEINVSEEQFVEAITTAHNIRPDRYTILSNGITEVAAQKALKTTGVI